MSKNSYAHWCDHVQISLLDFHCRMSYYHKNHIIIIYSFTVALLLSKDFYYISFFERNSWQTINSIWIGCKNINITLGIPFHNFCLLGAFIISQASSWYNEQVATLLKPFSQRFRDLLLHFNSDQVESSNTLFVFIWKDWIPLYTDVIRVLLLHRHISKHTVSFFEKICY